MRRPALLLLLLLRLAAGVAEPLGTAARPSLHSREPRPGSWGCLLCGGCEHSRYAHRWTTDSRCVVTASSRQSPQLEWRATVQRPCTGSLRAERMTAMHLSVASVCSRCCRAGRTQSHLGAGGATPAAEADSAESRAAPRGLETPRGTTNTDLPAGSMRK